jgi:allantoate deiminase
VLRLARRSSGGLRNSARFRTEEHRATVSFPREHHAAAELIMAWMRGACMRAHLDAIGNVCGRYEGERPGLPCPMLVSHYDTVCCAGKWDGPLV